MLKGAEVLPSNCTVACMLSWKDLIKLCSFGGHPIFRRMLKRPSLLTRSNALVRYMKAMNSGFAVLCISPAADGARGSCPRLSGWHGSHTGCQDTLVVLAYVAS